MGSAIFVVVVAFVTGSGFGWCAHVIRSRRPGPRICREDYCKHTMEIECERGFCRYDCEKYCASTCLRLHPPAELRLVRP